MKTTEFVLLALLLAFVAVGQAQDRSVLPPPAPAFQVHVGNTYQDSIPDWKPALPLQAPAGAPNQIRAGF